MQIPPLAQIHQTYDQPRIQDVSQEIRQKLAAYDLSARIRPGDKIAITAGSRGIVNLTTVYREVVNEVKRLGGQPFIVPAMGSHGGGTAEGQRRILEALGVTESAIGAPIRATMDVVEIGRTEHDTPVYVDNYSNGADGIIAVNRIKMHTEQHNATESGLMKIMAVGLGKQKQAELIHSYGVWGLMTLIPATARVMLEKKNIIAGIGLVENAMDETAIIEILSSDQIPEQEKRLLATANSFYPWLPFNTLDVLVLNRIGKNISGTSMDTNMIGRMGVWGLKEPEKAFATGSRTFRSTLIEHIVALNLTEQSHGNAIGVGQADVITQKLYDRIDRQTTYNNVITSSFLSKGKIPIVMPDDKTAIELALSTLNGLMPIDGKKDSSNVKLCLLDSTLHRGRMWVSKGLEPELKENGQIEFISDYAPVPFDPRGNLDMKLTKQEEV